MPITTDLATVTVPVFRPKAVERRPVESAAAPALEQPSQEQPAAPSVQEVIVAAEFIQKYLAESARSIEFRVDDASGMPVVTVRDATTGEMIRQIPNEEALHLAQMLKETHEANHALVSLTV